MMGNGLGGTAVTNLMNNQFPAWTAYLAFQPAYLWIPGVEDPQSQEEIARAHILALPVPVNATGLDPFFVPYYLAAKIEAIAVADMARRGQELAPEVMVEHIGARFAHYGLLSKGSVAPNRMVGGTERFIIANSKFLHLAKHLAEAEGVIVDPQEYGCPNFELNTYLAGLQRLLP